MAEGNKRLIVAVDGPAGVGKSTVTIALARELGLTYVETGALYRAVGYVAKCRGVDLWDGFELARLASTMDIRFELEGPENLVFIDGADVTDELHSREMGAVASQVSSLPEVRRALLEVQRAFGEAGRGAVAEGRDIGTVVFPDADFKFFVIADSAERTQRRFNQLQRLGREVDFDELKREIEERDRKDSSRAIAPLKPADDAVIIDTTHLVADEVVAKMLAYIRTRT